MSANKKVARILGIPHVTCNNHLFNSEVQYMVSNTNALKAVLDSIHDTMVAIKGSIKNLAVLRRLPKLKPEMGNDIRWIDWGRMLRKYVKIRPKLLEASENVDANISIDSRPSFKRKAENQALMFEDINSIAVSMQHGLYALSVCRKYLNAIIAENDDIRLNLDSRWYRNRLEQLYIGPDSFKLTDPHFISGVFKI